MWLCHFFRSTCNIGAPIKGPTATGPEGRAGSSQLYYMDDWFTTTPKAAVIRRTFIVISSFVTKFLREVDWRPVLMRVLYAILFVVLLC